MNEIVTAGLWGGLAAASLLVGAWVALRLHPSNRVTGLVMGFGAGALVSAIAYELIPDSRLDDVTRIGVSFVAGALVFFAGDWYIDRQGGQNRKQIDASDGSGAGRAIFLGTLLDGIPESLILGMSLALGGAISVSFLAAVLISNIPEAIAGTASLSAEGQSQRSIMMQWLALVAASALAAGAGYAFAVRAPAADGAMLNAFAAGAILTMLADSMMPEAFEHGGKVVGLVTALGFVVAAVLSSFE